MDVIFIGGIYPPDKEVEIRLNSKVGIDNASNNLQWAILEGLDYYCPNLKVVSMTPIRTYPNGYKKILFKGSIFSHKPGSNDYSLGFINLPLIKHLSIYSNLHKTLNTITNHNQAIIITYGIHSPKLKAIYDLKKKMPEIKTCLIVPDLPQYMSESRNLIYRFFKSIDSFFINIYLKKIDSFVLLSDYMADELRLKNKPWTRVEGIFQTIEDLDIAVKKEKHKTILYTGNIDQRYGIITLLEAFSLIKDENYRLWIRGNGNTKEYIFEAAKNDKRIKYFEEMTKKELLELQNRATVLINPVSSREKFTKYFFPSKTIDYLASGTPTIMNRLSCIPKEYFDYVFVPMKEDPEGLKDTILAVCSKDQVELNEFGKRASQFILMNKNPIKQVGKIYEMINKL